jgi:hypothetical protein
MICNPRRVDPEWLDQLPADDPRARRSRRDLRRINAWMGNVRILARLLQTIGGGQPLPRLVELGCGDGSVMLAVAQRLGANWRGTCLELVDLKDIVTAETLERYRQAGWEVRVTEADVFEWLRCARPGTAIAANLFFHHFDDERLAELLGRAAGLARGLVACEPRRFRFARAAGQLVWLLACNAVTRHDAKVSIRAGFLRQELSALWPATGNWRVLEGRAGLFSHRFAAWR